MMVGLTHCSDSEETEGWTGRREEYILSEETDGWTGGREEFILSNWEVGGAIYRDCRFWSWYADEASLEHVVLKLPVEHRSGDVLYYYFVNYPGEVHFCVLIPGRSFSIMRLFFQNTFMSASHRSSHHSYEVKQVSFS